jgi:hypothetical protein
MIAMIIMAGAEDKDISAAFLLHETIAVKF